MLVTCYNGLEQYISVPTHFRQYSAFYYNYFKYPPLCKCNNFMTFNAIR
jgi:hypothetical protein